MNWIDALIEMKKDNSKVFKLGDYKLKIKDGALLQCHKADGWQVRMLSGKEQEADWVETKQFKEVDYAEFMEWYCNPNNKEKFFKVSYRPNSSSVVCTLANNMHQSPYWFLTECVMLQIPNE